MCPGACEGIQEKGLQGVAREVAHEAAGEGRKNRFKNIKIGAHGYT
jgi:hypothetical protein